jgi:lysozyme family protein
MDPSIEIVPSWKEMAGRNGTFEPSLSFVLLHEGGYVNHPDDPGGPTNRGITQAAYDRWRGDRDLSSRSVLYLERHELEEIYFYYWISAGCDLLPAWLDMVVFDTAVNMGYYRAKVFLQKALRVEADGIIGPQTKSAIKKAEREGRVRQLIRSHCRQRRFRYLWLVLKKPKKAVFLKGWLNRIRKLRRRAIDERRMLEGLRPLWYH